ARRPPPATASPWRWRPAPPRRAPTRGRARRRLRPRASCVGSKAWVEVGIAASAESFAASARRSAMVAERAGASFAGARCRSSRMDVLDGPQSPLAPAGPEAAEIARIAWLLFAGATAIFVLVLVLAAIALWRAPRWLGGRGTVVVGGFVFPLVVLSALLVDSLFSAARRLASMTRS